MTVPKRLQKKTEEESRLLIPVFFSKDDRHRMTQFILTGWKLSCPLVSIRDRLKCRSDDKSNHTPAKVAKVLKEPKGKELLTWKIFRVNFLQV